MSIRATPSKVISALRARRPRRGSLLGSGIELALILVAALGLAYSAQAFVVKPYRIPSGSMEPTLTVGQRVLVDRIGMDFVKPHVGAIVVFHPPTAAEAEECGAGQRVLVAGGAACAIPGTKESQTNFIKRIVAGPGDQLYISGGHVYRRAAGAASFVREHDPYIKACGDSAECNLPKPITVPAGHWFMMGDNRGDSDDSRYWGPVPTGWIVGEAFATYWPLGRVGVF